MCGCKNCQGITFLTGIDGRGIVSITAQEDGTFIYLYTDGTTYTSPDLTGPQGPPGNSEIDIIGEDDIVVTEAVIGGIQTFTVSRPKEFFYDQIALTIDLGADPSFASMQYFSPIGYSTLTYTNPSAVTKTYKIHASYEYAVPSAGNTFSFGTWVDAALVKNTTILYEKLGRPSLSGFLYWGPLPNNVLGTGSPIHNLVDDQESDVRFRFLKTDLSLTTSFFFPETLLAGETVTLMFRTKNATNPSSPPEAILKNAQIMVEEL
jgi:hypothetical protein